MNLPERCIEFPHHLTERQFERRPPPDQHVIVAGVQFAGGRKPHHLPQAAPHAVALHGVAHLPRHCKAYAHGALVCAPARLQHERAAGRLDTAGGSPKVRPALQPLHGKNLNGSGAPSRTEPLAPTRAPRRQNLAATLGRRAGAKAVAALAHQFARLVGPFHEGVSANALDIRPLGPPWARSPARRSAAPALCQFSAQARN